MPENLMLASSRFNRPSTAEALELLGRSAAVGRVQELVRRAAAVDGGVLLVAETGVAVDSIAGELHARGRYAQGPLVVVECGDAEAARLDRLLFGTPASAPPTDRESIGHDSRIAAARGGVLFLKDVTELPAARQESLARIARDGEVRINGAVVETGFRLMASASPAIHADVDAHRFRSDLYRRLSAVRIDLPPLRERREDVPLVAVRLLDEICAARSVPLRSFTQAALALIGALTWPGNMEELRGAIDRAVGDSHDEVIQIEHILPALQLQRAPEPFAPSGSLREARLRFEREYITAVLQHHAWHMADAAQALGIQRPNLYRKARQLGIPLTRAAE